MSLRMLMTALQNHSCDPNVVIVPCYINEANIDKPLLTFFALKNIKPHEEICFSYTGVPDDDDEVRALSVGIGLDPLLTKHAGRGRSKRAAYRWHLYPLSMRFEELQRKDVEVIDSTT